MLRAQMNVTMTCWYIYSTRHCYSLLYLQREQSLKCSHLSANASAVETGALRTCVSTHAAKTLRLAKPDSYFDYLLAAFLRG